MKNFIFMICAVALFTGCAHQNYNYAAPKVNTYNNSNANKGCVSDFDCGYGNKCVKQSFSYNGVCMKEVNKFGVQQFNAPKINSIGSGNNSGGCKGFLDCPMGFKCDVGSGRCIR